MLDLEYTNIYSPVDGVVISPPGRRRPDARRQHAVADAVPAAADLARMQVSASVDEDGVDDVADGADVQLTVDAYPNDVFHGRIAEIRLVSGGFRSSSPTT